MKAVLCNAFGPPESLVLEEVPSPPTGPGDVRVAVQAAGLNFPDTLIGAGKYQVKPAFPFSPGLECAGVIMDVGAEVRGLQAGDRVMALPDHGAMAEELVLGAHRVFRIPDRMTFVEAAGFAITYGTVMHAFADRAHLKAGETLLVHGAAGGVGLNAVELGKLMGATVIACAGTDEKLEVARQYGADHLVNYSTESIRDRVKALTNDKGADVIFDPVGGDAFDQSMRCIAWGGRLLVIGFASGRIPAAPANLILLKACDIVGVYWGGFMLHQPQKARENFAQLFRWFEEGRLRPHVSMTFPLYQVPEAMRALLSRKPTGKVIIEIGRDRASA